MQLNRLFFALWPEPAVRDASFEAARQLHLRQPCGARLVRPERHHLTLLFLGDQVPDAREAAAIAAAAGVRSAPFELVLDQAGSFRNREIPWWLGPRQTPPALVQLHERLRDAMLRADVPPERMRFVPHLTIARSAGRVLPPTPITPIVWPVHEFVLIRSHLDRPGGEYELLGRWPLQAEPDGQNGAPAADAPAKRQLDLGF